MKSEKVLGTVIAVVVSLGAMEGWAGADGCFIWHKGADLNEPSQKAIILQKYGVEEMILQVKYSGEAKDFCWIVPVPEVPDLGAVEADVFAEISLYTQLRQRWGYKGRDSAGVEGVEVLERKKVGIYDTAVLKAEDPTALQTWLEKAGYKFPAEGKEVLGYYAKKKWVFVAAKIDAKEMTEDVGKKLKKGTIQALRFSFRSREIVYPLHISSLNAGETEVLLYVLADYPVWHPWFEADNQPKWADAEWGQANSMKQFAERWHGRTYYRKIAENELAECRKALPRMGNGRYFLTKLRGNFSSQLMTEDVVLGGSPGVAEEAKGRKAFTARLMIEDYLAYKGMRCFAGMGWQGKYKQTEKTVHSLLRDLERVRKEIVEASKDMPSYDEKQALGMGWFGALDEEGRRSLLRSGVRLHGDAVEAWKASGGQTGARANATEADRAAMMVCCAVLKRAIPEFVGWEELQERWPVIERSAEHSR